MRFRAVLAMSSAGQRSLARLGLEMSGHFDVVGVAVDTRDVGFVVGTLCPDVVLVDFAGADGGGLDVVPVVLDAHPGAVPVLVEALVARYQAHSGSRDRPRPAEVAELLRALLTNHPLRVAV